MERTRSDKSTTQPLGASFRDPAGFVFKNIKGEILRQINFSGQSDFSLLTESGLYSKLVEKGLLISHQDLALSKAATTSAVAVIKPQLIPFISYPFEWSFSQLQDAALLTLRIQRLALKHGMSLKDASAYNIQFHNGQPIFIDTLSFEKYEPGKPWRAYQQFCQHFLAPLALMTYTDMSLSQLLRVHLDGIPLELTKKLLPRTAKLKAGLAMHIVLHGRAQKAKAGDHKTAQPNIKQSNLEAIIHSLEHSVQKLKARKSVTEWGDYYDKTNYSVSASDQKAKAIFRLIHQRNARTVFDLGGSVRLSIFALN